MQRRVVIVAVTALLVPVLGACSSASQSKGSQSSPAYAADSVNARCRAQEWPQPMPDVQGQPFDPLGKDLMCFDNIEAMAPDGHDVMTDPGSGLGAWTVVSSSPGPGAKVRITTPITLELRRG
ncbi:PASTA domain-containing protein [Streptomyces sp. NPDC005070]